MPLSVKSPTGCRPDQLFGVWAIEPMIFNQLYTEAMKIDLVQLRKDNEARAEQREAAKKEEKTPSKPYQVTEKGIAILNVFGPTTKHETSFSDLFGGTSTIKTERVLKQAVADESVSGIMIHYETPGGTVAGSAEMVDALRAAAAKKPLWSHGSDLVTSAGMLYATQGKRFTANRTCELGSMGTKAVLYDTSAKYEKEGVKVVQIASGKFKGVGHPGTEITAEHQEYLQERIDDFNASYLKTISEARNVPVAKLAKQEAKVFGTEQAMELGLLDGVCSFEEAVAKMEAEVGKVASGPPPTNVKPAAAKERKMLTAEQLTQAQALPGCESITAENADQYLFKLAGIQQTQLKQLQSQVPAQEDESVLLGAAENALERFDILASQEAILPSQLTVLKGAVMQDGKPNKALLAKLPDGKRVTNVICDVLKENKPNGVLKEISEGNPAPAIKSEDKPKGTVEDAARAVVNQSGTKTYGKAAERLRKAAEQN